MRDICGNAPGPTEIMGRLARIKCATSAGTRALACKNMNLELAREYQAAIAIEAAIATDIVTSCEKEPITIDRIVEIHKLFDETQTRRRRTTEKRAQIAKALGRDASPVRNEDPVLDIVFSCKFTNKESHPNEHASLAKSIGEQTLGKRLKKYFRNRIMPKYALGYSREAIVIGSMEVEATPTEFYNNLRPLLPVTEKNKTAIELIRRIYQFHAELIPTEFFQPETMGQAKQLRDFCTRPMLLQ